MRHLLRQEHQASRPRTRARWWLAFAVLLFQLVGTSTPAMADGAYYSRRLVPPGVPYQRALIAFNGEREILVVQSRYRIGATQIEPVSFEDLWLIATVGLGLFLLVRLALAVRFGKSGLQRPSWFGTMDRTLKWIGLTLFVSLVLVAWVKSMASPKLASVRVLREETVGGLDIKVVSADDASALVGWLRQNGFTYDAADVSAFEGYIAKRWVFVTARVTAGAERTEVLGIRGMLAPLVLVFPARQAIYPLALTAAGGQETEIDLYVYHSGKMDAGGRLTTEYANRLDESVSWIADSIVPGDLLARESLTENFITHFHGRMTPEQMKDDLVLGQSTDNAHLHSSWPAGLWPHFRE